MCVARGCVCMVYLIYARVVRSIENEVKNGFAYNIIHVRTAMYFIFRLRYKLKWKKLTAISPVWTWAVIRILFTRTRQYLMAHIIIIALVRRTCRPTRTLLCPCVGHHLIILIRHIPRDYCTWTNITEIYDYDAGHTRHVQPTSISVVYDLNEYFTISYEEFGWKISKKF